MIEYIIAVDNVLDRFIRENNRFKAVAEDQILRVATEINKVHPSLRAYTMDAVLGGSTLDNPKLLKKAEKRVRDSTIVFTTCAGAGLGVLRRFKFEVVLIDEASQITEACALIPIVKGSHKAVLVGDQLSYFSLLFYLARPCRYLLRSPVYNFDLLSDCGPKPSIMMYPCWSAFTRDQSSRGCHA